MPSVGPSNGATRARSSAGRVRPDAHRGVALLPAGTGDGALSPEGGPTCERKGGPGLKFLIER